MIPVDGVDAQKVALAAGLGATFWASTPSNWYHLVSGSSGVVTPGGSSGQIQYDNAGAFGGFTASGDVTITYVDWRRDGHENQRDSFRTVGDDRRDRGDQHHIGDFAGGPTAGADSDDAGRRQVARSDTSPMDQHDLAGRASKLDATRVFRPLGLGHAGRNSPLLAASATTDTTVATNITSGTLPAARLPAPTATTLGGVQSRVATAHQWINTISPAGAPSSTQPAFSDLSGSATLAQLPALAASATTDTTVATNITSGTLPAARLPAPTATTLGGVESLVATPHQWINTISTAGLPASTQPAFSDLSGSATLAQLPTIGANTILGNPTTGTAVPSVLGNLSANADGSLTFTGISHSAPVAGDLWYPSSDQGTFSIGRASGQARLGGCIFSCGACTAVANTTGLTSVFGSPTGAQGSLTIPLNTLVAGNLLRWFLYAKYSSTASSPTLAISVILNGSTILSSIATLTLVPRHRPPCCLSSRLGDNTRFLLPEVQAPDQDTTSSVLPNRLAAPY